MLDVILSALILFPHAAARAEKGWETSLPKALEAAKKSGGKVLADFTAPWCYSCYYMEKHVLEKSAFRDAAQGLTLVKVDVDQPEGRQLKAAHKVGFIPSFLLLDASGRELGRLVGEQREEDFVAQLKSLLGPTPEDTAVQRLHGLIHRAELDAAAAFAAKPAPASKDKLASRTDWKRLELRLALKRKPTQEGLEAMLAINDGCELAYDVMDGLKGAVSPEFLRKKRAALEAWADRRLWVAREIRCADFRSGVDALAQVYETLGLADKKKELLNRAASLVSSDSGLAGLGADRNLDDDRRYFLDASGRHEELEELFPRLVEAYPSDYVYAQRFARWLHAKGRAKEALPWIEKAARLCYGVNRLAVTKLHAEILRDLGRRDEAAPLLKREIKAYGKALPKETRPLQDLLSSLQTAPTQGQ